MIQLKIKITFSALLVSLTSLPSMSFSTTNYETSQALSLAQAINIALENDPWFSGNKLKQSAMLAQSVAASTQSDPKVSLGMMNVPTSSWSFDQEAMTQLKIGVSQTFSRGDTLAIKQKQLEIKAGRFSHLGEERSALVKMHVSQLWLDAYLAQKTITLINQNKSLFIQMADIAKANYSSAIGSIRQQDIIRAQLELLQLEDRLTIEQQKLAMTLAQLGEWLNLTNATGVAKPLKQQYQPITIAMHVPEVRLTQPSLIKKSQYTRQYLAAVVANHPSVQIVKILQQVAKKDVALAKEQYKPQWRVDASYGYREDTPTGVDRDDFFSVGVTFDVPLFTENRQDQGLSASIAQAEAVKTEVILLINKMLSGLEKEIAQLMRLYERQKLYREQLLAQTHEHAQASLTAYTNDDGDFSDVVRSRIAELTTQISAQKIDIDALKTVVRINYFFTQSHNNTADVFGDN